MVKLGKRRQKSLREETETLGCILVLLNLIHNRPNGFAISGKRNRKQRKKIICFSKIKKEPDKGRGVPKCLADKAKICQKACMLKFEGLKMGQGLLKGELKDLGAVERINVTVQLAKRARMMWSGADQYNFLLKFHSVVLLWKLASQEVTRLFFFFVFFFGNG